MSNTKLVVSLPLITMQISSAQLPTVPTFVLFAFLFTFHTPETAEVPFITLLQSFCYWFVFASP